MFDKILVALDLNEDHELLFNRARSLAEKMQSKLLLLQVLDITDDYAAPFPYYAGTTGYPLAFDETFWSRYRAEQKARKEAGEQILKHLVQQSAEATVEADFIQAEGDPGKTICQYAKLENVDLVIVGNHGRRGFEELLLGSVSSYVMHRAPCAVMIAREQDLAREATDSNHSITDAAAA